jgi:hypothetical protein
MARWLVGIGIAIAFGTISVPGARAAVVCQNKKKPKLITLRADACTKKENVAVDLATLGTQAGQSADQGARLGEVQPELGSACPGDPSRTFVASKFDGRGARPGLRDEPPGGGCRTLDGNQAACTKAFQDNDPFTNSREYPASACIYFKGLCLPCNDNVGRRAKCVNTCVQSQPTCADPTRTVFLGGPGGDVCKNQKTQGDCEKSWHVGRLDLDHPSASCFWTGSACNGCGPRHANQGDCTNSCDTTPHRTCKDPTRTIFLAGQKASTAHRCRHWNGNQASCEMSYHITGEGTAATCWYDTVANECNGCGLRWETVGKCTNTCL